MKKNRGGRLPLESQGVGVRTFVVTVTYGSRRELLLKVLDSARSQGIQRAVVVDNASDWNVAGDLREIFGDWVDVTTSPRNRGSAGGFSCGMKRALELGADYLLLLDDDNVLRPCALQKLHSALARTAGDARADTSVVQAFRPGHQSDLVKGVPVGRAYPRAGSFRGFHYLDLPYKAFRRIKRMIVRQQHVKPLSEEFGVPSAPYSGLLFQRAVIERFGLPREDFLLYTDDTEFTVRITQGGGSIVLVPSAVVEDMESSWNIAAGPSKSSFDVLLDQGSDFRAYYSTRNGVYFQKNRAAASRALLLNIWIYMFLLRCKVRSSQQRSRYELVWRAVQDGLAGRLGEHPQFPL
jgi:GT2 family glycosyltransferase